MEFSYEPLAVTGAFTIFKISKKNIPTTTMTFAEEKKITFRSTNGRKGRRKSILPNENEK